MTRPVMALAATVAGASALTGVLAATPEVPRWLLVALAGVTAVGTAVGGIVTQTQTAPWKEVAARKLQDGTVVAGPASSVTTGATVDVTKGEDEPW
ncbi:hypothetical protein ACXJJ3_26690 [Kribbella sp. WER1]